MTIHVDKRTLFYAAVAIAAAAPVWIVARPPMMDVPFHLATIRVIHDFHDPAFGFDKDFVLTLGRTQYVLYYLLGSALAYVVGIVRANAILMSAYLAGTVLGVRALLLALRRDERACLLVVPLLYNVMFMYGLFPFLFGIPVMFFALACAVRQREAPTTERAVVMGALALVLFYCHVVPFGVFAIGCAALVPWTEPRRWPRAILPLVPAGCALLWWATATPAGRLTRGTMNDVQHDPHKRVDQAIASVHEYLVDVFRDASDDVIFVALVLVVLGAIVLAHRDCGDAERAPFRRAYALVPIACAVLYFVLPDDHGYIAIIAPRFPILFGMTALPLVRFPLARRGRAVAAAALVVALASAVNVGLHFRAFEREIGDFDGALAAMQPRKHVAALIFDRKSRVTKLAPYLHFGSYYQLERGGVVKFTYAGYAHWPFDFLPGHYPPPGEPARLYWEWEPEKVDVAELEPYFDYVLTRGEGFRPPPEAYVVRYQKDGWTVWSRPQTP